VHLFEEGDRILLAPLGSKGADVAEMSLPGLPVVLPHSSVCARLHWSKVQESY